MEKEVKIMGLGGVGAIVGASAGGVVLTGLTFAVCPIASVASVAFGFGVVGGGVGGLTVGMKLGKKIEKELLDTNEKDRLEG